MRGIVRVGGRSGRHAGELAGDGLAEDHRAGGARRARRRRRRRRAVAAIDRRAHLGRQVDGVDDVLDADRHAVQRAARAGRGRARAPARAHGRDRSWPRPAPSARARRCESRQSRITASAVNLRAAMPRTISVAESSLSRLRRAPINSGSARPAEVPAILPNTDAGHQAGAARIVEVEQAADQLARGIEAADRLPVGVEHLRSRC